MADVIGQPLDPPPADPALRENRAVFRTTRTVRADAVRPDQGIKFDGVARFLQDTGMDHLIAAGFHESHKTWIARRTIIDIHAHGAWPETITLERWASRIGTRWSDVRIDLRGETGTHVETEAFWINFNTETGTPSRMSDEFLERFGAAAAPGVLRWKRLLDPTPHPDAEEVPFTLRSTDIDFFEHVNNAVYWTALEHALDGHPDLRARLPLRGIVEHDSPLTLEDAPRLLRRRDGDRLDVWLVQDDPDGVRTAAPMCVVPLNEA
ncbi:thioesterase [Tsukamurella sp. 8F]|uniref:acyl-[acyl-carrier-protein] thioesterase n=1 Tax=unclassified Tsukamurella TaxID=2633480 RepID=UPI0023B895B4|nr:MULTISPECIES: acyl-ACP thioesterase domain-containing protein [unclassified Tsukamurella]MDF0529951.1 thioesterase [Tsukamurella sp. 8J]MDF0587277.1 thioesterase [Tsukamurella sp. 8F]